MAKPLPLPGHKFLGLASNFTATCECGWRSPARAYRAEAHADFHEHQLQAHGAGLGEPVTIDLARACHNCGEGLRYTVQPGEREGTLECGHKGDPACPASHTEAIIDRAHRLYAAHQIVAEFALELRGGYKGRSLREWMEGVSKDSRTMHNALDANCIFDAVLQRLGMIGRHMTNEAIEVVNAVTGRGHLERFAGEWLEAHPLPGHPPTVEDAQRIIEED